MAASAYTVAKLQGSDFVAGRTGTYVNSSNHDFCLSVKGDENESKGFGAYLTTCLEYIR